MIRSARPTYRHVFVVLAIAASVYFGVRTSDAIVANRTLAGQLRGAQDAVAALERQNAALSAQLAYEQTPAFAEQVAREQLGLMKPGDHVVHVALTSPPVAASSAPAAGAAAPTPPPAPAVANWRRWLQLFADPPQTTGLRAP
jgi:cell division protein FtsB